ncbi:MAG TPA: hypothetical protein VNA22_09475 [Pyrinomonadaceae bacterium]|nr:hypothetical protein [Pyrinomonadaceae bacterium]
MKTISRFFNGAALTVAVLAVGAVAAFGQEPCADVDGQTAVYTKFTEGYNKKTVAEMKDALATGKQFLEKYGACEALKEQTDFVKPHVARLEKAIPVAEEREKLAPSFTRFDQGLAASNPDNVLAAGKEILAVRTNDVNIAFAMALIAAEKSTAENKLKYADDGIRYSNIVLTKLKSGLDFDRKYLDGPKKGSPYLGVGTYNRDNKDQIINELTYNIAYLNFYGKKDKKTALPLYYELSQSAISKNDPRIYGAIGDFYVEEGAPIGEEIAKLITDLKAATEDTVKADLDKKIKERIAMFNGYTERALDAYSRAHNSAKAGPYKDNLYKVMQGLYKRRFDKDAGFNEFVTATLQKPFPNPTSPVQPVADPEPTTTTTSAPSGTSTTKPVSTVPATKAPVAKKGTRN